MSKDHVDKNDTIVRNGVICDVDAVTAQSNTNNNSSNNNSKNNNNSSSTAKYIGSATSNNPSQELLSTRLTCISISEQTAPTFEPRSQIVAQSCESSISSFAASLPFGRPCASLLNGSNQSCNASSLTESTLNSFISSTVVLDNVTSCKTPGTNCVPLSNGFVPQMISSSEIHKMAPASVYMAPSLYQQVALIPETDLLRSMIVQDVKQVTREFLDINKKKKRGRRSRKEEIIPGDFGTLTVNFTKFVDKEHPPFSLEDPPEPKRTVYQRIAPYPIAVSASEKSPVTLKPSKKAKGNSSRSSRSLDPTTLYEKKGTTGCNREGKSRRSYKSSRLKRISSVGMRQNRPKETRGSSETLSILQSETQVADLTKNLPSELSFVRNYRIDDTNLDSNVYESNLLLNAQEMYTSKEFDATIGSLCSTTCESLTESTSKKGMALSGHLEHTDKSTDTNSNILNTSADLIANSNEFTPVCPELLQTSSSIYETDIALASPGVIGNDLSSLLSELYSGFPPLSPGNLDERMDVTVPIEGQSTHAVSTQPLIATLLPVMSQTDDSIVCHSGIQPISSDNAISAMSNVTNAINVLASSAPITSVSALCEYASTGTASDQMVLPSASVSFTRENGPVVYCSSEVIDDSTWKIRYENATDCARNLELCKATTVTGFSPKSSVTADLSHSHDECHLQSGSIFKMEIDISQSNIGNLLDVVDISPEYASTEGGGKIILIGSWNNKTATYSCQFGKICTQGDLIQNGVLRCFCPPHKPGKVKVSVLRDDTIISKSVDFEYVDTEDLEEELREEQHDWLKIQDEDLKSLLVERIEAITEILDIRNTVPRFQGLVSNGAELEEVLVRVCEMISKAQNHLPINIEYNSDKVMTVLHLAAALGYTKLIQTLCNWVETNNNALICQEADPCKQDQFHLTPLMWACAKGKFDTVCVLLQWDESGVQVTDSCGCNPLSISRDQGHTTLVRYLEKSQTKGISSNKSSSFSSENESPNLRSSSQMDYSRDLQGSIDDAMSCDACGTRKSPGSNKISQDGSPEAPNDSTILSRTLGKTLVHVQAIIQDGVDTRDHTAGSTPLTGLDDNSLFVPSPFTPRTASEDRLGNHTPKSLASLSPASPGRSLNVQSPFDQTLRDTVDFCEFFYNSDRILEKDFAELTLTDEEQQNLYKAASVIQNAYKRYRERRKQRDVELSAAVLIQSYYRRYKQYATFKKMQRGAVVIQHKYRAHREKEKQKSHAASVIQSYYRRYKERKNTPEDSGSSYTPMGRPTSIPEWRKSPLVAQARSRNPTQE